MGTVSHLFLNIFKAVLIWFPSHVGEKKQTPTITNQDRIQIDKLVADEDMLRFVELLNLPCIC